MQSKFYTKYWTLDVYFCDLLWFGSGVVCFIFSKRNVSLFKDYTNKSRTQSSYERKKKTTISDIKWTKRTSLFYDMPNRHCRSIRFFSFLHLSLGCRWLQKDEMENCKIRERSKKRRRRSRNCICELRFSWQSVYNQWSPPFGKIENSFIVNVHRIHFASNECWKKNHWTFNLFSIPSRKSVSVVHEKISTGLNVLNLLFMR